MYANAATSGLMFLNIYILGRVAALDNGLAITPPMVCALLICIDCNFESEANILEKLNRMYTLAYFKQRRARHRVAFHWLSQATRAVFARLRPIIFKPP